MSWIFCFCSSYFRTTFRLGEILRVNELLSRYELLIFSDHYKHIRYLLHRKRTGYLNETTKEALQKYLEIRKDIIVKSSKDKDVLFASSYKKRITVRGLRKTIKKAYEKLGIDNKEYSVHTLRHTCATLMYKTGIDINTIKEVLGHIKIDTTEIYTHLHDEKVMKAMQEHPLSKFKIADALSFCVPEAV